MTNSYKHFTFFLLFVFLIFNISKANEPFVFDVTEIEILNDGNQINGYKGGTVISEDGSKIIAENFFYNKLTNILEATGNVKFIDELKDTIITSDKATYLKNDEKIFTTGNSKAYDKNNSLTSIKLEYDKFQNIFKATGNVKFIDELKDTIITSDKATYLKNDEKIFTTGNSKAYDKNNSLTSIKLEYDKFQNIFKATGNVKFIDELKDTIITSDKATYLKNDEKIFTDGKTNGVVEKKYIFDTQDLYYKKKISELSSKKKTNVKDDKGNTYILDNFLYEIESKILKGKNVNIFVELDETKIEKLNENKIDQYYFSEGFFNLGERSFLAKKTEVKIHKSVFDDTNQDPRVYGATSSSNKDQTIINNGVFTSCKLNDTCPPWSISAKKITHDKIKENLIYKDALLKIYDVPIFYFPKFFHPDPSVKRRSGFLRPQLNGSTSLESSLFLPYFKTLGPEADLTFKPTIFEDEKFILRSEFRKEYKNSSLISDFSHLRNYYSASDKKKKNINHLFLNYSQNLNLSDYLESDFDVQIQKVTSDNYLKVFQYHLPYTPVMPANKDTMTSNLNIYLDKDYTSLSTGIQIYENLSGLNSDRYQYILPYYNFSKNLTSDKSILTKLVDGNINFSSTGTNALSNTNNLRTSISNDLHYSSLDYLSKFGTRSNYNLYFKNNNNLGKKDSLYSSKPQIDGGNMIKLDTSLPLTKKNSTNIETLTPKISFRTNPANNTENYSDTRSIIDAHNVFDVNRLGLTNAYEPGNSLTFGIDYKFDLIDTNSENLKEVKDKYLEFKLATILRDKYENDVPVSSTINRKSSNIFGSLSNNLYDNIKLDYDFSLDNDLKTINSHKVSSEISINNFLTTFNYIEERSEIGSTHVISNNTEYKINDQNYFSFSTSRNQAINLTEYYNLSYEYKNDCLTAALRFNKTFYSDGGLVPSENLFFTITLIPLTTHEKELYKRSDGWFVKND
jgi:LPS-assembly protein